MLDSCRCSQLSVSIPAQCIYSLSESFLALCGASSEDYFSDPLGTSKMFCKTSYPEENCLWKVNINDQ